MRLYMRHEFNMHSRVMFPDTNALRDYVDCDEEAISWPDESLWLGGTKSGSGRSCSLQRPITG